MTKTTRRRVRDGHDAHRGRGRSGGLAETGRRGDASADQRSRPARFPYDHACLAPQWVAEELLRAEGFMDFQY